MINMIKKLLGIGGPDPSVQQALNDSKRRLTEARQAHKELEPEIARLRDHAERNHFESAVLRIFKVAK